MKVHLVYDIAPSSTRDVADGLRDGLRSCGVELTVSPTHQYVSHLMRLSPDPTGRNLPPDVAAALYGLVAKLILADAMLYAPDVILVVSGWVMPRMVIDLVRRHTGARAALYLTESPYQDQEQVEQEAFGAYDLVFCNELASLDFMAASHGNVVYLPHSINPEVHRPPAGGIFSSGPAAYMCATGFTERMALLGAADWSGLSLVLEGFWPRAEDHGLGQFVRPNTVANRDLPRRYYEAGANLNIHRTTRTWHENEGDEQHVRTGQSIGPRVYEVLAAGGFLMTDHRREMDGFLRDGQELVIFDGPRELSDKLRHYLARPDERLRISEAGRRAVSDCTFSSRAQNIILPALSSLTRKVVNQ